MYLMIHHYESSIFYNDTYNMESLIPCTSLWTRAKVIAFSLEVVGARVGVVLGWGGR